jgi:hypothetical protein
LQRWSDGFKAQFHTGVRVQVRAARTEKLATRSCEATLGWNAHHRVVATSSSQIDVDTFGVDLGIGFPIATFQVKKSGDDCCMDYQVYSLDTPPHLLRTITGGDYFSAADKDMDGGLEIWTNDAAAVDGFERLSLAEVDSAPTVVLRFAHGELLDVSSEFQPYFDQEITGFQKRLDTDALRDFKRTDGKVLPGASFLAEQLHRLRGVKTKILEIVWAYLYSGREVEAWCSLAEMWTTAHRTRIQTAILNARDRGIRSQVDRVTHTQAIGRSGQRYSMQPVNSIQGEGKSRLR